VDLVFFVKFNEPSKFLLRTPLYVPKLFLSYTVHPLRDFYGTFTQCRV